MGTEPTIPSDASTALKHALSVVESLDAAKVMSTPDVDFLAEDQHFVVTVVLNTAVLSEDAFKSVFPDECTFGGTTTQVHRAVEIMEDPDREFPGETFPHDELDLTDIGVGFPPEFRG